jgi:lipopolysaccharide/colanic/teichoic acid biosynthesis glycosyltransferase
MYRRFGKRVLDVAVAAVALPLALPLVGLVALAVRLTLGSPVLFRQERPGWRTRSFHLVKFRSMTDARDAAGELLPDGLRLGRFGRFLRSTSLDELPTLWNVLRGDMSVVGPRPLLMQYLTRYSPRQARRHDVRPGITGLAQVSGRNALAWQRRLELDVQYVERLSFLLDLEILALTIWQVAGRRGISQPGRATADEFKGESSP